MKDLKQLQEQVVDLDFEGVNVQDSPKFTGACISAAKIDDDGTIRQATGDELKALNSDYWWVNGQIHQHLIGMVEDMA